MNAVLKIFLSLSLSGSILILALLLCKPFLKSRVSKRWQYYIWLVVIARLLLPFTPETSLINNAFHMVDHAISPIEPVFITPSDKTNKAVDFSLPNDQKAADPASDQLPVPSNIPLIQEAISLLIKNLWLVWLMVAFLLLFRKITIYQSFVRYIKAGQTPVTDIELLNQLSVIAQQMGIKNAVELCVNPLISSPLLIGFLKPYILLPSTEISKTDFSYIILHELTHYRRRDILYKWLTQITICLHWFNPFVYQMSHEINRACEFSCDEAILTKLEPNSKTEYGKALLNAMAKVGNYRVPFASVTLSENKKILKERLCAIMDFKKKPKIWMICSISLTLLMILCASFTGAYAMQQNIPDLYSTTLVNEILSEPSQPFGSLEPSDPLKPSESLEPSDPLKPSESLEPSDPLKPSGSLEPSDPLKPSESLEPSKPLDSDPMITEQTIIYKDVSLIPVEEGKYPFIHDILINHTDKTTKSIEHGMLAFDKAGKPLMIDWLVVNSDYNPSYYFLYDWGTQFINPGETYDIRGGWSLNSQSDPFVSEIKYVLYCIKSITFEDGTIWENPDFENWRKTYEGKTVDVSILENYYPYVHSIKEFKNKTDNKTDSKENETTRNDDTRVAILVSNNPNQLNISESGSFIAYDNEVLTLSITSNIKGGYVDLFLFDPDGRSQDIRISGEDQTKQITLSKGTWAYNCSGLFKDGGDLHIEGIIKTE